MSPLAAPAVPLRIKLCFGVGSVADGAKNAAFNSFLMFYYSAVLGLPAGLGGAAIFVAMLVDALTDPLMGSVSDNFRSRWGRRHPFMYLAAVPMGACFYALLAPPSGLGVNGLFVWLSVCSIGVRVALTLYAVPSAALAPEMTADYDERTRLVSYRWMFGWLGGLAVTSAGWFWFLRDTGEGISGRLEAANYPALGLFCATLVTLAIGVSSAGTHALIPKLRQGPGGGPLFSWARFAAELGNALRNRSYRTLLIASLFSASALGVQEIFGTYVGTYFWEFRSEQIGILSALAVVPVVAGVLAAGPLSARFDKRRAGIGLALFAVLWGPLPIALRLAGWMPENGTTALFVAIALHGALLVFAAVQLGILYSSMLMDVVDESELATGLRQEGIFVSAIAFTGKAVSGLGNLLGGVALQAIGFPEGAQYAAVGVVPSETVVRLGLAQGPGMMLLHLASLSFLARYGISRRRYGEIRRELAGRRGGAGQAGGAGA
jgi:Na+/melibiose symporter-like transporter